MTIVFIHGAGFTGACFERQTTAFPASAAPSLPGHCSPGFGDSVEKFARDLANFITEQRLEDYVLCGHSMGGAVALQATLDGITAPRAIILIGGGARLRVAPAILAGMREDFPTAARDLASHFFAHPDGRMIEWAVASMLTVGSAQTVADFEACNAFDVLGRLGEIDVPLLAITGEADVMTPPKYAATFADRVPGAQTRIIADAGHFAMVERPDETNEAIATFLSGVPKG